MSERNRFISRRGLHGAHSTWSPRKVAAITAIVLCASVVIQFLYPTDRLLPNAHLGTLPLGPLTHQEARAQLSATYKDWSRKIVTDEHEYTATPGDVGMQLDIEKTIEGPFNYPWWQRLIPGSLLWRVFNSQSPAVVSVQADVLKSFSEKIQQENYKAPANAAIIFNNEQASVQAEQDGVDYSTETITVALGQEFFGGKVPLRLSAKTLSPEISSGEAQGALKDTTTLLEARPSYSLGGESKEVSKVELIAMLDFPIFENHLKLDLSSAKVEVFLSQLRPYTYMVPKGTVPSLDGRDVESLPGDDAKAINVTQAVANFRETLKHIGKSQTVDISQIDLTATLKAKRSYSKSQLGLRALVNNLVAEKGNYGIALQELSDRGWSASAGGDKKFITASTYKLFVAYAVLKNIESGAWHWGDSMISGHTVESCFNTMIINSDNACAEAMGESIGWANIQGQMRGLGLTSTSLGDEFTSTAKDELLFMTKLGRGEILSNSSREKLIDVMKRQVYRLGIPEGTDLPVADKVGFLYGLLHDAALVYAPQGTYALVILTNGSSWGNIADAAKRIQDQLD